MLWLVWLNVFKPNTPFLGPVLDRAADILRPVVATKDLRLAPTGNDLLQSPDHPLTWELEVHVNALCFAVEIIDDIEQS